MIPMEAGEEPRYGPPQLRSRPNNLVPATVKKATHDITVLLTPQTPSTPIQATLPALKEE